MQKKQNRISVIILAIMFALSVLCLSSMLTAGAEGEKSMTLNCTKNDVVLDGMYWKIYRVGERQGGEFVLTGDFAKYPVDIKDMSAENVGAAAQTLESYSIAGSIPFLADGFTGPDGTLAFSGLDDGLYMAVGNSIKKGIYTYIPSPLLLEVGNDGSDFSYDAYPKIVRATLSDAAKIYTVKKIWLDYNDTPEVRPNYITVDIFRDGEAYDTVTLNESNNWEYKWVISGSEHQWRVVERDIPVDYEVRIEYNETQYLIRNRHKYYTDWGTVTRTTSTATSTVTTTATDVRTATGGGEVTVTKTEAQSTIGHATVGSSVMTTYIQTTTNPSGSNYTGGGRSKLPQTGQLWWPVAPLGIGGTLMLFTGMMIKPKKDDDEEE